jgi:hypothetical protein
LGGLIGETIWIEEETVNKSRLDKERILILVTMDKVIPSEIQVKFGNGSFPVRVEESSIPISNEWLTLTLGVESWVEE